MKKIYFKNSVSMGSLNLSIFSSYAHFQYLPPPKKRGIFGRSFWKKNELIGLHLIFKR